MLTRSSLRSGIQRSILLRITSTVMSPSGLVFRQDRVDSTRREKESHNSEAGVQVRRLSSADPFTSVIIDLLQVSRTTIDASPGIFPDFEDSERRREMATPLFSLTLAGRLTTQPTFNAYNGRPGAKRTVMGCK